MDVSIGSALPPTTYPQTTSTEEAAPTRGRGRQGAVDAELADSIPRPPGRALGWEKHGPPPGLLRQAQAARVGFELGFARQEADPPSTADVAATYADAPVEEHTVVDPAVTDPVAADPAVADPAVADPVVEDPVVDVPAVEDPVVEHTVVDPALLDDVLA